MSLCIEELSELEKSMRDALDENLLAILTKLNRSDQLCELLRLLGMEYLLNKESGYRVQKYGKILVIGQSDVKLDILLAIAKKLDLDKNRFEFHLQYDYAKKFRFSKIQWDPTYSVILVGPMPHSGGAKGEYGSIISAIEHEEGYPPVVRLGSGSLKITKNEFKTKLQDLLYEGIIA